MKIATQVDVDIFIASVIMDESIYPYLTVQTFFEKWKVPESDWNGVILTNSILSYMAKVVFDRTRGQIEFNICLFAKNALAAGRGIESIKYLIKRYKPKALNSIVHESNIKSLNLHKKIFGDPWGVEEKIAWNALNGEFEDLYYFRKML